MAFNGSGTFLRVHDWTDDAAASINIDASRMDAEFDGVAAGLSNCITRDGQSTITTNIPFNGQRITGLGTPTGTQDAATKAYVDLVDSALTTLDGVAAKLTSSNNFSQTQIITGSDPALALVESDGTATVQRTQIARSADSFQIQTRDATDNSLVSIDYLINIDASGATRHSFRLGGAQVGIIQDSGTNPTSSLSLITRGMGDVRYTLASSSIRYKTDLAPVEPPDLSQLAPFRFTWGGDLSEDDPRRGHDGYSLLAEHVASVFPDGATYNDDGQPEGLNHSALIAALLAEVNALKARVAELEAA